MLATQNFTGVPVGDTLTVSNSGAEGETPLDTVFLGTDANIVSDDTVQINELPSVKITTPAVATTAIFGWNSLTLGNLEELWTRAYYRLSPIVSNTNLMRFSVDGTSIGAATLIQMTNGTLRLTGSTNTDAPAVPTGQLIRVEMRLLSHLTAGEAEVRVFLDPDSDTPDIASAVSTGLVYPASYINTLRVGITGPVADSNYHVASIAVSDEGWIGPYVPPPPPPPVAYYDDGTNLLPVDVYYDNGTDLTLVIAPS